MAAKQTKTTTTKEVTIAKKEKSTKCKECGKFKNA